MTRPRAARMAVVGGLLFAAVGCTETGGEQPVETDDDERPRADASTKSPKGPDASSRDSGVREEEPDAAEASEEPTEPTPPAASKVWCDARAVLQDRCQTCHGAEVEGAPMSLVTWADTQAMSKINKSTKVSTLIESRVHDKARPMPPVAQGPLTSDELAALDTWIEAGYPNGTCDTPDVVEAPPTEEFKWPAECTPDKIFTVKAHQNGRPYPVRANWEDNVSITVPVPWAGKFSGEVQALGIKPLTNNKRVVHHWILYAGTLNFITSWSPGKEAETFPEDVGVYMPSSGSFQLNMHYYNMGNDSAEQDESGAEICITDKLRPKTATTNMFGPVGLNIPPGRTEATSTCTQNGSGQVTLITSSPHMHKTGVNGKFEIIRANGDVEVLDDSPFNQEDQTVRPINAVLNRGDKVRTTCTFVNMTTQIKRFGESTEDEMCFNFSRYYPRGALSCRSGF